MQWLVLCTRIQSNFWCCCRMGFERKILPKRTAVQASDPGGTPQASEKLQTLKMKRPRDGEDEGASGPLTLTSSGAVTAMPHCPPAPPKKPRLVLGCSLDGFKVLRVMDLRCFLR